MSRIHLAAVVLGVVLVGAALLSGLGGALHTAKSFQVTCSTTATLISGGDGHQTVYCDNNSTTSVFIGGADVVAANGVCLSTTTANCPRRDLPPLDFASGALYCRVAASTQVISCLSGK